MVGEIGHSKFDDETLCSCGQTGCLEAIIREDLMHNNGEVGNESLTYLSRAISSAINLMDTSLVILTGDLLPKMGNEKQLILIEMIKTQVVSSKQRRLKISMVDNCENAIISGMSAHIFKEHFGV
jgi:predicted NBD/HSP70 family sugar kinase